jgi:hypothetical protein
MASACSRFSMARTGWSLGTLSPKNTTSGFMVPPQDGQLGTTKPEKSLWSSSASPSGKAAASKSAQAALRRVRSSWKSSRRRAAAQARQRTKSRRP